MKTHPYQWKKQHIWKQTSRSPPTHFIQQEISIEPTCINTSQFYTYIYIYFKNQHLSFTYIQVLTSIRRKKPYRNSNAVSSLKEVSSTSLYFVVWQTAFILFWHFLERLRNKPSNIFVRWKLISYPHIILNSLFLRLKNLTHKQVLNRAKVTETKKNIYIYIYLNTCQHSDWDQKKISEHSPTFTIPLFCFVLLIHTTSAKKREVITCEHLSHCFS